MQDARRHGVSVLPIHLTRSDWECTLEDIPRLPPEGTQDDGPFEDEATAQRARLPQPAVRLGLCLVAQLQREAAERLLQARLLKPFSSTEDLALRARLTVSHLQSLAAADALAPLSGHRRQQVWDAAAQRPAPALLSEVPVHEEALTLEGASEGEEIVFEYAATGFTLRRHPLALLRSRLSRAQLRTALQLRGAANGETVRACGIVTVRQRTGSAGGTMFVTLEDETGPVNVIVWPSLIESARDVLLKARLLAVEGT